MTPRRPSALRPIVLVLVALSLVAAACGQKSGVALSASSATGAASGDLGAGNAATDQGTSSGDTVPAAGDTGATVPAGGGAAPVAAGTAKGGGTASKPGSTATGGTTNATSPAPQTTGKQDRTGIDDGKKEIVIGIHAPVTGAAPIEQKTFDYGKDVYWKFVQGNGGILGSYNVRVVFRDDQFSPTVARQKCQEMVENDKAFLLVGAAGADQITSCARYAESVGVPYVSAGVNTDGLDSLRDYFALSMTYAQQAPLLAQLIKNKIGKQRVGLAVLDTPDFVDAKKAAIAAIQANGGQVVSDQKIPKTAGKSETDAAAAGLARDKADVIYTLMSPTIFVNFIKSVKQQVGYDPDLVAPGLTLGLNLVAQLTCPDSLKLQVLSPFPQMDVIDSLDPDYKKAYQQYVTSSTPQQQADDIGLAIWGVNKIIRQVFEAASTDGTAKTLSRQSFLAALASGKEFKSNVYPPVKASATNHFGVTQAHLLKPDCTAGRFVTAAQFASGF